MTAPRSEISRARNLMEAGLRSHADFEAFFIDYFPEVHRRCSGSMDRTERMNLLLQLVPAEEIISHFEQSHRHRARVRSRWRMLRLVTAGLLVAVLCCVGTFVIVEHRGSVIVRPSSVSTQAGPGKPAVPIPPETASWQLAVAPRTPKARKPATATPLPRATVPEERQHVVIKVMARADEVIELYDRERFLHRTTARLRLLKQADGREVPDGTGAEFVLDLIPGVYRLRCPNTPDQAVRELTIERKRVTYEAKCD